MARTLEMTFLTELGKTKTIRVSEVKEALDPAEVAACMNNIIAKNIFTTGSGDLYAKLKAQVVITTNNEIALT